MDRAFRGSSVKFRIGYKIFLFALLLQFKLRQIIGQLRGKSRLALLALRLQVGCQVCLLALEILRPLLALGIKLLVFLLNPAVAFSERPEHADGVQPGAHCGRRWIGPGRLPLPVYPLCARCLLTAHCGRTLGFADS